MRTVDLAEGLRQAGCEVDILFLAWTREDLNVPGAIQARPLEGIALFLWRAGLFVRRLTRHPYAMYYSRTVRRRVREAVAAGSYDVVDFQHTYMWQATGFPSVVTMHNVLENPRYTQARGRRRRLLGELSASALEEADRVVVFSDQERDRLTGDASRVRVVPIGYRAPTGSHPLRPVATTLAYVGSFDYEPNVEAARWLIEGWDELVRHTTFERLMLVGRRARDLCDRLDGQSFVTIRSDVADIATELSHADVLIVPLIRGGGTRVKVVEAFAVGVAVCSTALGVEGLPVDDGVHCLIASDRAMLRDKVEQLQDLSTRSRLVAHARSLWEEQLSQELMVQRMMTVYDESVSASRSELLPK